MMLAALMEIWLISTLDPKSKVDGLNEPAAQVEMGKNDEILLPSRLARHTTNHASGGSKTLTRPAQRVHQQHACQSCPDCRP